MTIPSPIRIYRLVHWKNVEYILHHGICCGRHPKSDPDYINIGHRQLISDRNDFPIPIPNAGNLGDYIPFYFAGHSPMLYLIMNGFKGVTKRPQEDLVYLVSTFQKIKEAGLNYVFTNMNAKIAIAEYFNSEEDFDKIHWEVVEDKFWGNDQENLARQDYKQAEFLVKDYVPASCITAIVVKTKERKKYFDQILSDLALEAKAYVDKNCKLYY